MTRAIRQLLIPKTGEEETKEPSCDECLRVLDYEVDRVPEAEDTPGLRFSLATLLSHCSRCRLALETRLDAWDRVLRGDVLGSPSPRR